LGAVYRDVMFQDAVGGFVHPGVQILSIVPEFPADLAGLKAGDIVFRINDNRVNNGEQMIQALNNTKGGKAKIKYLNYATEKIAISTVDLTSGDIIERGGKIELP
jgi:S1-C subfamily serine protease